MSNLQMPRYDLLGFGIAAVDDVLELASLPPPGGKAQVLARKRFGGGLCATALVAAARLGLRCYYGGVLGNNDLSDFTRRILSMEAIELPPGTPDPDAGPCHSIVLVERPTGERIVLYSYELLKAPEPLDPGLLCQTRALFIDHFAPERGLRACALAREIGIPTIADLERLDGVSMPEMIALVDHLIVPARIAAALSGCADPAGSVRAIHQGRACTAVTDGVRGCWFVSGAGAVEHQPAFPVRAVDTTGCGDVFHGAYAAALLADMPVGERIRFASAAAALKALHPGAQAGAPGHEAVEQFLCQRISGKTVSRSPVEP
jgi:sugar/nucleoside kinase (ribokinase family)